MLVSFIIIIIVEFTLIIVENLKLLVKLIIGVSSKTKEYLEKGDKNNFNNKNKWLLYNKTKNKINNRPNKH